MTDQALTDKAMTQAELYLKNRQALIDGHAYDPSTERDACDAGVAAARKRIVAAFGEPDVSLD